MPDVFVDASGEECPVPLELAIARIEKMTPGQILLVRSTDPVSPIDFEAWCERETHEYLGAKAVGDTWEISLRVGESLTP